jgi:predicted enzyme related to lactoylglutathione lyase
LQQESDVSARASGRKIPRPGWPNRGIQQPMQVRVARPTRDLGATVSFYELLELPVLGSFEDHDGFSGVIFGLPDSSRQLELVLYEDLVPTPTEEDQLVLYLGSADAVAERASRIRAAGFKPVAAPNPYWARTGAVCFVDPDGYRLVLSPETW